MSRERREWTASNRLPAVIGRAEKSRDVNSYVIAIDSNHIRQHYELYMYSISVCGSENILPAITPQFR